MRPRTRRDGRNRSGLRAIRGGCFGAARHIGDRPAGYGANGTPPVHAWAFLLASIHGRAGTHWQGPNNIAAVHSRADDPFRGSQIRPYRPGSWHWFRLPGRNTGASGAKSLYR